MIINLESFRFIYNDLRSVKRKNSYFRYRLFFNYH